MTKKLPEFWHAYLEREDLLQFKEDSLLLFALQLKFGIEDITTVAVNSITEGSDDKKVDLVYIDSESGLAVVAQTYLSNKMEKSEAPANKASDLNTGISWLLNRAINELPTSIKSHAEELRNSLEEGLISSIYIWYVHNLPESKNVLEELKTVEHSAISIINSSFKSLDIQVQAQEIGVNILNEWYQSLATPILVNDEFSIPVIGGYEIEGNDWSGYVTTIPAKWLYQKFKSYQTNLFSANVRDYLGSRKTDKNINSGIKETADNDPNHFWVYNNGITALVHNYEEDNDEKQTTINIKGISIVNGAQTTGAIGNLSKIPSDDAKVQIRFIKCQNVDTIYDIVRFNNSQNKINAPDFRSNDPIQRKLREEFKTIPSIEYLPRRGGHEDLIKRRPDVLPSVTAGQSLAALHRDPEIAYHKKTNIWESDTLYSKYFNEQTTAKHILFSYTLLKSIEAKKVYLLQKSKSESLTEIETLQLEFYRKRGSIFMMSSAISSCLEIFINIRIPNLFRVCFKNNPNPQKSTNFWTPIVDIGSSFSQPLAEGLSDGFRNKTAVTKAITTFQSLVFSTKDANKDIYHKFSKVIECK